MNKIASYDNYNVPNKQESLLRDIYMIKTVNFENTISFYIDKNFSSYIQQKDKEQKIEMNHLNTFNFLGNHYNHIYIVLNIFYAVLEYNNIKKSLKIANKRLKMMKKDIRHEGRGLLKALLSNIKYENNI